MIGADGFAPDPTHGVKKAMGEFSKKVEAAGLKLQLTD
jgi:hypothetical protein